jgi:hypothetical protein
MGSGAVLYCELKQASQRIMCNPLNHYNAVGALLQCWDNWGTCMAAQQASDESCTAWRQENQGSNANLALAKGLTGPLPRLPLLPANGLPWNRKGAAEVVVLVQLRLPAVG